MFSQVSNSESFSTSFVSFILGIQTFTFFQDTLLSDRVDIRFDRGYPMRLPPNFKQVFHWQLERKLDLNKIEHKSASVEASNDT